MTYHELVSRLRRRNRILQQKLIIARNEPIVWEGWGADAREAAKTIAEAEAKLKRMRPALTKEEGAL